MWPRESREESTPGNRWGAMMRPVPGVGADRGMGETQVSGAEGRWGTEARVWTTLTQERPVKEGKG